MTSSEKVFPTTMAKGTSSRFPTLIASTFRRVYRVTKTSLALVGLVAITPLAYEYHKLKDDEKKAEQGSYVLVLPFHRMKIVERSNFFRGSFFPRFSEDSSSPIEIGVSELVDLIHAAALDPKVTALYGQFSGIGTQGRAHIEEIRNAIRVFNQIHRVHPNPNVRCDPNFERSQERNPKITMAFAKSLDTESYVLASEFENIWMQNQGTLELLGISISTPFLREAFDKYGIKVHAFKHGKYKNSPNSFTHRNFDKAHLEATKSLVVSLENNIRSAINESRLGRIGTDAVWNAIHEYGILTADEAHEISFIDAKYPIDPLMDLVAANSGKKNIREDLEAKWGAELNFPAAQEVSVLQYKRMIDRRKSFQKRKEFFQSHFNTMKRQSETLVDFLKGVELSSRATGELEDYLTSLACPEGEKIAIVYIENLITSKVASNVVDSLSKIKKDPSVKSVILRVNSPGGTSDASEQILMECADMPQPVICSMGNFAASGGYYVASNCHRIFANPSTITGSIGAFLLKFDFSDIASRYGVSVQHVGTGSHAAMMSEFQPLTKPSSEIFSRHIAQGYEWFKAVVSIGRGKSLQDVEKVAQGRIWTGVQALEKELVDEIGGLDRAIRYAQRNFTVSGQAEIEVWPKQVPMQQLIAPLELPTNMLEVLATFYAQFIRLDDRRAPLDLLSPAGQEWLVKAALDPNKSHFLSRTMLTIDENDAIRLMIDEAGS